MLLEDLTIVQSLTPHWGGGHYLAQQQDGDYLEVLVAERSSESVTSLLSWANALERVDHPSIPRVKTIVHQQTTFVALQLREGQSLSQCIHQHHDQLSRLDILTLFYQLATALRKLHDHGLNHGNITLDHMKIVGEGELLLQGWAPPTIDKTFALRCVDELKRFKNFFYLTLVGNFPPQNRLLRDGEAEAITPIEKQRITAWREWYQAESALPAPNLSGSELMLFSEVPKSAQALIEELAPYLDQSLNQFYQQIQEELKRRENFESLCYQREVLLNELDRIYKLTRLWLTQHEHDRHLGDQHCHHFENLYGDVSVLHEQLEMLGGKAFYGARQSLAEVSPYMSQGSNTLLYDQSELPSLPEELKPVNTFGGVLGLLEHQWSQVDPHRPISVQPNEISHLMSTSVTSSPSESSSDSPLSNQIAQLIDKAQLPPVRVQTTPQGEHAYDGYSGQRAVESSTFAPHYDEMMPVQALSELGIEPLPSPEELRHVSNNYALDQQQSTQLFQRLRQYHPPSIEPEAIQGLQDQEQLSSAWSINAFIPDGTATNFTQHYQAIQAEGAQVAEAMSGPALALSRRNFFMFLYLTTGIIFVWSMSKELLPQFYASPDPMTVVSRDMTDTERRSDLHSGGLLAPQAQRPLLAATSPKLSPHNASMRSSQGVIRPQASASSPHHISPHPTTSSPPHHQQSTPTTPPQSPEGMVYIPGGITYNGLGEQSYQTAVSYCSFEPRYSQQKRSRDRCKRLIPSEQKSIRAFHVDPFFIDIYEVSRGEYLKYCRDGGACNKRLHFTKSELDLPMVNVSMLEAHDYCHMQKKTLPSYQQWLFAARGDQQLIYPWGNHSVRKGHQAYRANYKSSRRRLKRRGTYQEIDGHIGPHSVRFKAQLGQSPYGVAHMVGNVSEWVVKNKFKAGWAAGGSWQTPLWDLRVTTGKLHHKYEYRSDDLGFRCARPARSVP